MKAGWVVSSACAAGLLACVGCAGDVATEVRTNAQVRERVITAFASDGALAEEITRRLVNTDSLRARVVETVLQAPEGARYVLTRTGQNRDALQAVLQVAMSDSAGRDHLMTLFQGMQMAMKTAK